MKIGATFKKGRQRYECVGFRDHVSRVGHESTLIVLRSRCAECGAPFEFMTTRGRLTRGAINRRCDHHKRPGVQVRPRRRAPRADHVDFVASVLG
jgi:hypothetical protein